VIDWLLLTVGVHLSVPADLHQDQGFTAQVGTESVYAWASYDEQEHRSDLGSDLGDVKQAGVGIGARVPVASDTLYLTVGVGKLLVDSTPKEIIAREYIRNSLRNDFGEPPFSPKEFSYRLSDATVLELGLEYWIRPSIALTATYRAAKAKEKLDMWTGTRHDYSKDEPDCRCWWQQTNQVDLSSFSVGVRFDL